LRNGFNRLLVYDIKWVRIQQGITYESRRDKTLKGGSGTGTRAGKGVNEESMKEG
jgi:hypothetical protein